MNIGDFINTTWIGSFGQSEGGNDLVVSFNHIGQVDINIIGHSTATGVPQFIGHDLFMTVNRSDNFAQAFVCHYDLNGDRNVMKGIYLHYNTNPVLATPMNLRKHTPVTDQ